MAIRFRTGLDLPARQPSIRLDERMVAMGSCFSQAIGHRLADGGVDVAVTPMGILFNPISIGRCIERALNGAEYTDADLFRDQNGVYHVLDFESRCQSPNASRLLEEVNIRFKNFSKQLVEADRWLITFGTAWCFNHLPTDKVVGNCHKLPDSQFERRLASVGEIVGQWSDILEHAPHVVFTVSPVRHLNNGLHGNTLSKSRLHLAIEQLCDRFDNAEYFPAYEALIDDLRDYRFYADDMKHPSAMAEDYIFELFTNCYFSNSDRGVIEQNRRESRRNQHRPILE